MSSLSNAHGVIFDLAHLGGLVLQLCLGVLMAYFDLGMFVRLVLLVAWPLPLHGLGHFTCPYAYGANGLNFSVLLFGDFIFG